jgi:hippurate hydrolase
MIRITTAAASLAIALLCLAGTDARADGFDVAAAKAEIDGIVAQDYPHLDALYKDIHSNPELGFQEVRTAAILAKEMRELGFDVTEKVGGTGIVALYRNGPGPTVLVRTELDALPMEERTGLPYASHAKGQSGGKETFVAHTCGHDSHMAWWLGTAHALIAMKSQWSGTLMFIGQPAEELIEGAKAMISDGLFTRFPRPDYAFAAHVGPMPVGLVIVKDGTVTSAADSVEITFKGRGAHGSMPAASIDPIVEGAHFVTDVQTIISREKDPAAFGVITVGAFQAGSVGNIIPSEALLKLTLRSFSPDVRSELLAGVERTAKADADMAKAPAPEVKHVSGTAAVVNDTPLVNRTWGVVKAAFGPRAVLEPAAANPISASEDFSEFVEAGVPGVFFAIGGMDPQVIAAYKAKGEPVPVNHSPFFAPSPEPTIKTGAAVLALAVLTVTTPGAKAATETKAGGQ